jgi:hypothetical protein
MLQKKMYNNCKRNRALSVSISVVILAALSTTQLLSMVTSNDNIPAVNKVYATLSDDERQSRIQAHGTDSMPMNLQLSNPRNEIAQVPPSPPGPPFSKQQLQVTQVSGPTVRVLANEIGESLATCATDEILTGGGTVFFADAGNKPLETEIDGPLNTPPTEWQYRVDNPGPGQVFIRAEALCAKLVDAP